MPESLSRTRGLVGEITFIAPLHAGHVSTEDRWEGRPEPTDEQPIERRTIRYADRLRLVLEAFNDREALYDGHKIKRVPMALRAFGGIHFAHLALLDGETRLLFSVDFDGSPHDYLAGLAHSVPALLHMVFCNCVGWRDVSNKPQQLIRFVEAHQVRTNFWFAHAPGLSVRDAEWLSVLLDEFEKLPADTTTLAKLRELVTKRIAPLSHGHRLEQMFDELAAATSSAKAEVQQRNARIQFRNAFGPYYPRALVEAALQESLGQDVRDSAAEMGV